jgi:hypothetical protein
MNCEVNEMKDEGVWSEEEVDRERQYGTKDKQKKKMKEIERNERLEKDRVSGK